MDSEIEDLGHVTSSITEDLANKIMLTHYNRVSELMPNKLPEFKNLDPTQKTMIFNIVKDMLLVFHVKVQLMNNKKPDNPLEGMFSLN